MSIYRNKKTGFCLNGDYNYNHEVGATLCNGEDKDQTWTRTKNGALISERSSKCLDGNPSGLIYKDVCNGSKFQEWSVQNPTDKAVCSNIDSSDSCASGVMIKLVSSYTGLCLDNDSGNKVHGVTCSDADSQQWIVI
jgi:hypothetical protein